MKKFGMVRPILNKWHPGTAKPTYWFPSLFSLGSIAALLLSFFGVLLPTLFLGTYLIIVFSAALFAKKSFKVAFMALYALFIQFFGYGYGFLKSTILVNFSNKRPEEVFPKLFF